MSALCFTGHRPDKLNGYDPKDNKKLLWEISRAVEYSILEGVDTFISGMALGVDMWSALIVLKLKEKYPHIKLVCAIPCKNHSIKWNKKDQDLWVKITQAADEIVFVTETEYTHSCMQDRNEWMVDNSDTVLAVWDGTSGGTGNCVIYAQKEKKEIEIINPKNYK